MQKIGALLVVGGAAVFVGFFVYHFVAGLPWYFKIAAIAVGVGGILILGSLIRERVKGSKKEREKFKEVDR